MKSAISKCLGVLLALTLSLAFTTQANATAMLRYAASGGPTLTITDNVAPDFLGLVGGVGILGPTSVGSWTINSGTGLTYPVLGTQEDPQMQFLTNISTSTAGTLVIEFTQTDFNAAVPFDSTATLSLGGWETGSSFSILYEAFLGTSNTAFAADMLIDSIGPLTDPNYAVDALSSVHLDGAFSLTQRVTVTTYGGAALGIGGVALDLTPPAAPVPEPSTFILLGAGLAGLAVWRKKRS